MVTIFKRHYFITISVVSIFFLICFSPIFSLIWLCLPSLYFLYKRNYNDFFKIWAFTLFVWHSLFTFIFLDFGPIIIIGGDHTKELIGYLLLNDETVWFKGLCYQTIYIFNALSQKFGFLVYVPIFFPIKKTSCIEDDSKSNPSESTKNTSWFGGESKTTKTAREDFHQCGDMAEAMKRSSGNFFTKSYTEISKDGKRSVTASQTFVPFLGLMNDCRGRDLTDAQKDLMESNKK